MQINSVNPPGNELAAVELLAWHASNEGFTPAIEGPDPNRPNLICRLPAEEANRRHRPLILNCHLDTVPVDDPDRWQHGPFSGHEENGYIWGRGTIDMKGFAAMAFTAISLLKRRHFPINRDVIFAAVADEEAGTKLGSRWLVENRPELLGSKPEYVINEVGGFTVHRNGKRFYPVQVAEKGIAWLRMTAEGTPGHSSLPPTDSSVATLIEAAHRISRAQLPWHPSPEAAVHIAGFAAPEGEIAQKLAGLLGNRLIGPGLLRRVVKDPNRRAATEAILRNTATPTRFQTAEVINALPAKASVDIDGRLAPGQSAEMLIRELQKVIGPRLTRNISFEIKEKSPPTSFSTDTELYRKIEAALKDRDPDGHVVPSIIPGFTDSHNYARLGATCYGFYPLQLPEGLDFAALFHGDNERLPVAGFHWGLTTLMQMLGDFLSAE